MEHHVLRVKEKGFMAEEVGQDKAASLYHVIILYYYKTWHGGVT